MRAVNLLSGEPQQFLVSDGGWSINAPHTVAPSTYRRRYPDTNALVITPVGGTDITVASPLIRIPSDWNGRMVRGFGWIWSDMPISAQAAMAVVNLSATAASTGAITIIPAQRWTLVNVSANIDLAEQHDAMLTFTIPNHPGQIYLSYPVLTNADAPADNTFARQAYLTLPDYLRDADATLENPQRPLYRFLDVCSAGLGDLVDLWEKFRAIPLDQATDDTPAQSSALVDPLICARDYLPWLASLLGFALRNPSVGGSDWQGLEGILINWFAFQTAVDTITIDTFVAPTFSSLTRSSNEVTATIGFHDVKVKNWVNISGASPSSFNGDWEIIEKDLTTVTWAQAGANESATTVGTLTFYDTEWEELSAFLAAVTNVEAYLRSQVKRAFFGLGGGKVSTFTEIVRVGTDPTSEQRIKVVPSTPPADPWLINVYVVDEDYISGSDPSEGLQSCAPAGFTVEFTVVDAPTFALL